MSDHACMYVCVYVHISSIVYKYQVHRMPYVDYSSKQVEPLLGKDEVLAEGSVHQAMWRLQRKRYAIRVEFVQTGTLGRWSLSRWGHWVGGVCPAGTLGRWSL